MNKFFYARLAWTGMRKNARTYVPYLFTCAGSAMMYYIIKTLSGSKQLAKVARSETMLSILALGAGVIVIFSLIFLFYTSSFLIKRRKREFGLYNILGMEKKHIARIMLYETIYCFVISLVAGIGGGLLLSRGMMLVLLKCLQLPPDIWFEFSPSAAAYTAGLFAVVFALTLLNAVRQVHLANPAELLRGGQVGEREPKTRHVLAILGAICLGAGYYIAVTVTDPIEALLWFFAAVILVIIGTYCLFTAGSIAVLKLLRKNRRYYYKSRHFISVSGMMYRMKQNAAGLASICILSTMVLVMLSGTTSLYMGMRDVVRARYPRELMFTSYRTAQEDIDSLEETIGALLDRYGLEEKEPLAYRYERISFQWIPELAKDGILPGGNAFLVPLEDWTRMTGSSETLGADEALVFCKNMRFEGEALELPGRSYRVRERLDGFPSGFNSGAMFDAGAVYGSMVIVLPDVQAIHAVNATLAKEESVEDHMLMYLRGVDVQADKETCEALNNDIMENIVPGFDGWYESYTSNMNWYYSFFGGLLFLGVFLGTLFAMATVLLIYYKQISEGFDDRARFEILQKVGMGKREVKQTIHSQVLTVFFLPLIAAAVHIAFAFPLITRLLAIFEMYNVRLFAICTLCTVAAFGLFYSCVYMITARAYYKTVSN